MTMAAWPAPNGRPDCNRRAGLQPLRAAGLALLLAAFWPGHTGAVELTGQVRGFWLDRQTASVGPLAQANLLQAGSVPIERSAATLQTELRASGQAGPFTLNGSATLQLQRPEAGPSDNSGWINEAALSGSVAGWQWSAGKKVVSWDVGYGFRPNDMVQQELRRALVSSTLEGRPLLLVERFDAERAWSLVWVNPGQSAQATGASEPALAARFYQRSAAVDWHAFGRYGRRTGASIGAAASWVASDALELHASWRGLRQADTLASSAPGAALLTANPWQQRRSGAAQQALLGGTWTAANQLSLLLEVWHDGNALSNADWSDWAARNQALLHLPAHGAPASAVAGNLAWQASALAAASNLRRSNRLARLSWQHDAWSLALDLLTTPADRGRVVTASALWQGDRVKLEAGLRVNAGPSTAVLRQLPWQRQAYAMTSWAF